VITNDGAGTGCPAKVTTNGYTTSAIFNVPNGANPTLAVDGCAPLPLLCDGAPSPVFDIACTPQTASEGTVPVAGNFSLVNPYFLTYTTTTSNGTVTTSWRVVCQGVGCLGTSIPGAAGYIVNNLAGIATINGLGASLGLILYEGGIQTISNTSNPANDEWYNLFTAINHDPRAVLSSGQLMAQLRAVSGFNGVFAYYENFGQGGVQGQNYALMENTYGPITPKWLGALDFMRRNPCWWTACRH
jgi:hypothetical protein